MPDLSGIPNEPQIQIETKHHFVNKGRAAARNTGLFGSLCALTAFVDADVWVDPAAIFRHVAIHHQMLTAGSTAITFGLFETFKVSANEAKRLTRTDLKGSTGALDFRILCDFKEAYTCCSEDAAFVGRRFEIFRDTNDLNAWPREGWFGPWMLPEMCLGGFFMVPTGEARSVGGFDESFDQYGYEETTLVAKLMGLTGAKLVPLKDCRNLHIDVVDGAQSRADKDEMLRKSYLKYHNEFLSQEHKNQELELQ
nr:glycosyltransferase family 2 protein [Pseudovibrio sp. Tun.PSC04-5.I4]